MKHDLVVRVLFYVSLCFLLLRLLLFDAAFLRTIDLESSATAVSCSDAIHLLQQQGSAGGDIGLVKQEATDNRNGAVLSATVEAKAATTTNHLSDCDSDDSLSCLNEKTLICYGSQGQASTYQRLKTRLETTLSNDTYRFIYHAYNEPCAETETDCLHLPNTVPAEGRNVVVKNIVTSSYWKKCKYLVFFDDDAYLLKGPMPQKRPFVPPNDKPPTLEAWKSLHAMLLDPQTTYPLISPQADLWDGKTGPETTFQSCVDEVFWAIRYDHVDFVYPLSTIGRKNYWLTNVAMWFVMEKCFPAGVLVDHRWYTRNNGHRYSKKSRGKASAFQNISWRNRHMELMLERDYGSLGPWNITADSWLDHSCNIRPAPSVGVHPKCKTLCEARFRNWLSGDFIP